MSGTRAWLYRGLILIASGLFVFSWLQPWWQADIEDLPGSHVQIRPWGLEHNLAVDYRIYINSWLMPDWFAPVIWAVFGILVAALLFSLFARDRQLNILGKIRMSLPQLLILGVGVFYIITVAAAVIIAAIRTGDFGNMTLIGTTFISLGGPLEGNIHAYLLWGYWFACGVGPLLIILALLRNKIIGQQ